MVTAARSSAGPGMMLLGTSPVASVGRSYATLAGRDSTALNVSGFAYKPDTHHSGYMEQHKRSCPKWGIKENSSSSTELQ